jgi:hypothetical protein
MANPNPENEHPAKKDSRQPVPEAHRQRIAQLVVEKGLYYVAERILGIGADTVARIMGGLSVQPGTRALVAAKIAERDSGGKAP